MNDGGLVPAAPRHSERYSAHVASPPWGTAEDLVLWPVLAACGSDYAYREACLFLCRALNRPCVYAAGAWPSLRTRQDDAVALIEHRLVTDVLNAKRPEVVRLAMKLPAARSGQPLTWAECEELIPQYVRKLCEQKPTVSEQGFYALLGRDPVADAPAVQRRVKQVRGGKRAPFPPDRRPLVWGNVLEWVVRDFASKDPEKDLDELCRYWEGLGKLRPEAE